MEIKYLYSLSSQESAACVSRLEEFDDAIGNSQGTLSMMLDEKLLREGEFSLMFTIQVDIL